MMVDERLSWDEAEAKCVARFKGHLAAVQSKKHLTWIAEQMKLKAFWIGKQTFIEYELLRS